MTDDELMLVNHAGGAAVEHFEIGGNVPKNHVLELIVEQYEKGEFINDAVTAFLEGKLEDGRSIGFGVRPSGGN